MFVCDCVILWKKKQKKIKKNNVIISLLKAWPFTLTIFYEFPNTITGIYTCTKLKWFWPVVLNEEVKKCEK